jgi:hypothetical protein
MYLVEMHLFRVVGKCIWSRVGQNRISAPYMIVCTVISLLETPYVHRIYL